MERRAREHHTVKIGKAKGGGDPTAREHSPIGDVGRGMQRICRVGSAAAPARGEQAEK